MKCLVSAMALRDTDGYATFAHRVPTRARASIRLRSGVRVFFVGVLVGAYVLEFLLLAPVVGDAVFAFALIPIVAIAWLFGLRGGLIGAAAMVVASLVLMQLFGGQ